MVTVDGHRATFKFFRPDAARVWLIGDFNGWREGELAMTLDEEGFWRASLDLSPGSHRFRYVADGQSFADYASFGVEPGPFGHDSIVRVDSTRCNRTSPWDVRQYAAEAMVTRLDRSTSKAQRQSS